MILNNTSSNKKIVYARSLINGLINFLLTNKGTISDRSTDRYIMNDQYLIHSSKQTSDYISQQAQGGPYAGRSVDQANLIVALMRCYRAFKPANPTILSLAETVWDSYVRYYYQSTSVPTDQRVWIANKRVNTKYPVLANYPVASSGAPTNSGFVSARVLFSNGVGKIEHGLPSWGQYVDCVTAVYDGAMSRPSIAGQIVEAINGDPIYDKPSTAIYQVETFVDRFGRLVHRSGSIQASGIDSSLIGTINLSDTTVNGWHSVNYSTRNEDSQYGRLIELNQPITVDPIEVPITDHSYYTNDPIADRLFYDACCQLYEITNNVKYANALKSVRKTIEAYNKSIDNDYIFYKTTKFDSPFVRGGQFGKIETSPSECHTSISRDKGTGYTRAITNQHGIVSIKEHGTINLINDGSTVVVQYGIDTMSSGSIDVTIDRQRYSYPLPTTNGSVDTVEIPLSKFQLVDHPADSICPYHRYFDPYGSCYTQVMIDKVDQVDKPVIRATFARDDSCGVVFRPSYIGRSDKFSVRSITYKSTQPITIRVIDDDNWVWKSSMITSDVYRTYTYDVSAFTLDSDQPYHSDDDQRPIVATSIDSVNQIDFRLQNSIYASPTTRMSIISFNGDPVTFNVGQPLEMTECAITVRNDILPIDFWIGNVYVDNKPGNRLRYVEGAIGTRDVHSDVNNVPEDPTDLLEIDRQVVGSIRFNDQITESEVNAISSIFVDSQAAFKLAFGVDGPMMTTYVWNHPTNQSIGPVGQWIYRPDNDKQQFAVALSNAAQFAAALKSRSIAIPQPLSDTIIRGLAFVDQMITNKQQIPCEWYEDGTCAGDIYSVYANANYITAGCFAAIAGIPYSRYHQLIEPLFAMLREHYIVQDAGNYFNGGWSERPNFESGIGPENDGLFPGYYPSAILNAIASYLQYHSTVR